MALAAVGFAVPFGASAQIQRSMINPGFEQPALTASNPAAGCFILTGESQVPGWDTTHPTGATGGNCAGPVRVAGRLMELWLTPFNGVTARAGVNHAELNANVPSRLFQNVCLLNNETIAWRFSHRGRSGRDVMSFNVGASLDIVRVATTQAGVFDPVIVSQGTASAPVAGGGGWVDYSGQFAYAGATGNTSLGFESISAAGGGASGNFLDRIEIDLRPFVEFVQPASSANEGVGDNLPAIRINGAFLTATTVTVTITGGTAALGTDYTTPGNSTTLSILVPAGTYDGVGAGSIFTLPITVVDDNANEANETILLTIPQPPGATPSYYVLSTSSCGAAAVGNSAYTIINDDGALALSKAASVPVAVAGQPTQFDIVYTVTVNNPSNNSVNYSLVDTPGFDANVNIVSASVSLNGGAATTLATTGPWTLQTTAAPRAIASGATDTYVISVRVNINRGGTPNNDACLQPSSAGNGLHNSAVATRQPSGQTFAESACRPTPTPAWVVLRKTLTDRAVASDQAQIRLRVAGNLANTATTSGAAAPATASTGVVVLAPGATLQFEESIKANGTGADQAPLAYNSTLACTNATAGSPTVLPAGAGTTLATRREWAEFTPVGGDDLDCTITNTARRADVSVRKTNTPGVNGDVDQAADTVTSGAVTSYTLTVSNPGPDAADGTVLADPAAPGLTCATASCTASGGASCPAVTGAALVSALQGAGATIPALPAGGSVAVVLNCTVN